MLYFQIQSYNRKIVKCKYKIQQLENQLDILYVAINTLKNQKSTDNVKRSRFIDKKYKKIQDAFNSEITNFEKDIKIVNFHIQENKAKISYYQNRIIHLETELEEQYRSMDVYFNKIFQSVSNKVYNMNL